MGGKERNLSCKLLLQTHHDKDLADTTSTGNTDQDLFFGLKLLQMFLTKALEYVIQVDLMYNREGSKLQHVTYSKKKKEAGKSQKR